MVINADDTKSDVTGWVTIDNRSGATYGNASLKLVAGDVNRAVDGRRAPRPMEVAAQAAANQEGARDFKAEGCFEYPPSTLDGRTTVKEKPTTELTPLAPPRR